MHKLNIDPWFVNRAKQTRDGRLNAYDTLDARKTALVVVDMQNYLRILGNRGGKESCSIGAVTQLEPPDG